MSETRAPYGVSEHGTENYRVVTDGQPQRHWDVSIPRHLAAAGSRVSPTPDGVRVLSSSGEDITDQCEVLEVEPEEAPMSSLATLDQQREWFEQDLADLNDAAFKAARDILTTLPSEPTREEAVEALHKLREILSGE